MALSIAGIWSILFPALIAVDRLTIQELLPVEEEPSSA
jgi:hypothetical protein